MTCKPYNKETNTDGFCFGSLICKIMGVKFPDDCVKCFAAIGIDVDNEARPSHVVVELPDV